MPRMTESPAAAGSASPGPTSATGPAAAPGSATGFDPTWSGPGRAVAPRGGGELVTSRGRTSIADTVVRKIAGVATRQVAGVHDLGTGGTRAVGSIRQKMPGSAGPSVAQGVAVEVGERQAAIDLDIVVEYGVAILDLAQAIRRNVITSVEQMTGLEVTEVNIAVDDVYIPDYLPGDPLDSAAPGRGSGRVQ